MSLKGHSAVPGAQKGDRPSSYLGFFLLDALLYIVQSVGFRAEVGEFTRILSLMGLLEPAQNDVTARQVLMSNILESSTKQ